MAPWLDGHMFDRYRIHGSGPIDGYRSIVGCRRQSESWRECDEERWYGGTSGSNGRWWFWDLYCDDPAGIGSIECGPLGINLCIGGGYCKDDEESVTAKLDEPISDTTNAAVLVHRTLIGR
jgi:hypothetical protein